MILLCGLMSLPKSSTAVAQRPQENYRTEALPGKIPFSFVLDILLPGSPGGETDVSVATPCM
jgi:hypothetical protein